MCRENAHYLAGRAQFFCHNFWCFSFVIEKPPILFVQDQSWTILSSVVVVGKLLLCQGMSCVRKLHQSSWADWKEVAPEYCMSSSNFSTTDSVILSPSHLQKFSGSCHFCFFLTPSRSTLLLFKFHNAICHFPSTFSSSIWIKEFLFLSFQFGPFLS